MGFNLNLLVKTAERQTGVKLIAFNIAHNSVHYNGPTLYTELEDTLIGLRFDVLEMLLMKFNGQRSFKSICCPRFMLV